MTDSSVDDTDSLATETDNTPRTLTQSQAGSTVVVRGQARHKRKEISSQTLTREDIGKVVATAQDPVRALPTLPGVSAASDLSVRPIVRGGDLAETGVELDGIPLLMPYHFGSVFSIFHQEALEDFQFYSGVAPARAEGALSGTLLARTRPPRADSLFGGADISLLRSSAWINVPIVKDKLAIWASGQTMWYDWTLKRSMDLAALLGMADKKAVDDFEQQVTLPTSWDAQAGLSFRIRPDLLLDVGGFLAGDKFLVQQSIGICQENGREVPCYSQDGINRGVMPDGTTYCFTYNPQYQVVPCPAASNLVHKNVMDTSAMVGLDNWLARARLAWNPDPDFSVEAVAALQSSDWQVRFPGSRDLAVDSVNGGWKVVRIQDSSKFSWTRSVSDLQLSARRRWTKDNETSAGVSWRRESEDVETELLRPLAELILGTTGNPLETVGIQNQEGLLITNGSISGINFNKLYDLDFHYASSETWNRPSAWVEHRWDPDAHTRVRAGVRISGTPTGGMEIPSPRLQVQHELTESDLLGFGAALHTQSELPFEWRLAASTPLVPEKAWLGIVEWEHSFGSGWRSTISGWGKWYQDLASAREVASGPVDSNTVNSVIYQYAFNNQAQLGIPDSVLQFSYLWDRTLSDSANRALGAAFYARQEQALRSYVPAAVMQQFVDWSTPHRLNYASTGIGWAAGIEASLRYRPTDGWTGWASAEWSMSRRKDFDGGIWYPFGQERPWKFSWVNAFRVDHTWELSIRYSILGGNPYTPFKVWNLNGTENTYNSTSDTTIWIGSRNSGTLAPYQRLDLRISKESTVFGQPATWYWEIWNAFNDPNFVLRDASTGEFRWITTNLPIPMVFVGVQTRF